MYLQFMTKFLMEEILQISSVSHDLREKLTSEQPNVFHQVQAATLPPTIMEHQIGSTKDVFVPKKIVVLCNLWEVLSVPGDSK